MRNKLQINKIGILLLLSLALPYSVKADDAMTAYARRNSNITLRLDWRTGNYGSIVWQRSADGTNWTDIPGATGTAYTYRPTTEQYIRAVINGDEACQPIIKSYHIKLTNINADISEITNNSVTFNVSGLTIPKEDIVEWGVCHNYYGLSRSSENTYREKMGSTLPDGDDMVLTCTGLEPNSKNSVRLYFKTKDGSVVFSSSKIVETLPGLEWNTQDWQIGKNSVTAKFKVAGGSATSVNFQFGTPGNITSYTPVLGSDGIYTVDITGLNPATDYQATVTADVDGDEQTITKTIRTWTDYSTYTVDNTVKPVSHRIVWDRNNRIQLSPDNIQAEYARLVRVSADTILLTYHGGDGTAVNTDHWHDIYLQRSTDGGKTWSNAEKLMDASKVYSNMSNGWNRFSDPTFTRLSNGWILMQFIGNANPETNDNCRVLVSISKDGGQTWGDPITVGTGRTWEPQIVQLPGGELELLVSSEAYWWDHQRNNLFQEILCSRSTDNGQTWTAFTRASYNPGKRDGMPVPILMQGNKGILFSIESINSNESPSLIHRDLDGEWNTKDWDGTYDSRRWVAETIRGAAAPYCLQLPTGEIIVMGHTNQNGSTWQTNREAVCIGDNTGHNFKYRTLPFSTLPSQNGAYYGSLFLKDNNTIWLAYSHSIYDGNDCTKNCIEYIEGRIEEVK